jgi:hypothetical protein
MRFKRADYLLPAYPGAALLVGSAVERWWRQVRFARETPANCRPWLTAKPLAEAASGLVLASCVVGWWVYLEHIVPAQEGQQAYRRFATEIRRQTPDMIIFFRAEAHNLAFHVGQPLSSLLEWENLDWWAGRPESVYLVMPTDCFGEWPLHLTKGRLEAVVRSTDLAPGRGERPLVLVRTRNSPQRQEAHKVQDLQKHFE